MVGQRSSIMAATTFSTALIIVLAGLLLSRVQKICRISPETFKDADGLLSYGIPNDISLDESTFVQVSYRVASKMAAISSHRNLTWSLLLLWCDVSVNPGPAVPSTSGTKVKCGLCKQAISWNLRNICCVDCNRWFHISCQSPESTASLSALNRSLVSLSCPSCSSPNYSNLLSYHSAVGVSNSFDSLSTSSNSPDSPASSFGLPVAASSPGLVNTDPPPKAFTSRRKTRPLRFLNQNCRSIRNKKPEFWNLIGCTRPDIIVVTESWLNSDIGDGEFFPPQMVGNYNIFRRERVSTLGGGVFIAVSSKLSSSREPSLETECEILWVKVKVTGCKSLYICAFYNPDESNASSLENFEISLQRIPSESAHIWIAGDLNLPGFDWKHNCLLPNCRYPELTRKFVNCLGDYGLAQLVKEPTRGNNVLDLFITNIESLITKTHVIPGISDHDAVFVEGNISPIINKQRQRLIPLYNQGDWDGLRAHMSNFADRFVSSNDTESSVNELWSSFRDELKSNIRKFIPH